jgi:hypothetical protein
MRRSTHQDAYEGASVDAIAARASRRALCRPGAALQLLPESFDWRRQRSRFIESRHQAIFRSEALSNKPQATKLSVYGASPSCKINSEELAFCLHNDIGIMHNELIPAEYAFTDA